MANSKEQGPKAPTIDELKPVVASADAATLAQLEAEEAEREGDEYPRVGATNLFERRFDQLVGEADGQALIRLGVVAGNDEDRLAMIDERYDELVEEQRTSAANDATAEADARRAAEATTPSGAPEPIVLGGAPTIEEGRQAGATTAQTRTDFERPGATPGQTNQVRRSTPPAPSGDPVVDSPDPAGHAHARARGVLPAPPAPTRFDGRDYRDSDKARDAEVVKEGLKNSELTE